MNVRSLLFIVCALVCIGLVSAVLIQGSQLSGLRAEQHRLTTQLESAYDASVSAPAETKSQSALVTGFSPSSELLQLRNQINRLTARKRELAGVTNENEHLRAHLAARAANPSLQLPPGYLKRSEARMAGYDTPEATIESYLWAIQNRDFDKLLQALTPDAAKRLQAGIQKEGQAIPVEVMKALGLKNQSLEDLFSQSMLPGLRIIDEQVWDEGRLAKLILEIAPGQLPIEMGLQKIGGHWKIDSL